MKNIYFCSVIVAAFFLNRDDTLADNAVSLRERMIDSDSGVTDITWVDYSQECRKIYDDKPHEYYVIQEIKTEK